MGEIWLFLCNSLIRLYMFKVEMIMNSDRNNNYNVFRNSYQTTRIEQNTIPLPLFFFLLVSYCTWLISPTVVKPRMSLLVTCTKLRCARVKIMWLFNSLPFAAAWMEGSPAEQPAGDARGCLELPGRWQGWAPYFTSSTLQSLFGINLCLYLPLQPPAPYPGLFQNLKRHLCNLQFLAKSAYL